MKCLSRKAWEILFKKFCQYFFQNKLDLYDLGYFPRGGHNGPMHHDRHLEGVRGGENSDGTQPAMMSFKTFLGTQDDTISDEEAIKKYAEYKLEFKRQQLNEFFVNHKDEEWYVSFH